MFLLLINEWPFHHLAAPALLSEKQESYSTTQEFFLYSAVHCLTNKLIFKWQRR